VKGTPTFFINSVRHTGGYDAESLTTALERAAAVHPSIR
jgi:protein-disulfide isomerase